jgi:hypothetical protein
MADSLRQAVERNEEMAALEQITHNAAHGKNRRNIFIRSFDLPQLDEDYYEDDDYDVKPTVEKGLCE